MTLVLNNAQVFRSGVFSRNDVSVSLGDGVSRAVSPVCVDASSFVVLPGFVDVHVHLREPGFSYKETIRSGSLAAAHGGYTTVCAMPNLNPVPDSMEHLQPELDAIRQDAVIRVLPYGAITEGEQGEELADLEAMAPYVVAFSDDGKGVQDRDMMRRGHAGGQTPGQAHRGPLRGQHPASWRLHPRRRLCQGPRSPGHLLRERVAAHSAGSGAGAGDGLRLSRLPHLHQGERGDLIRKAKAEGLDVTCETGPHYLLLDDSCLQEDGRFKMNPPLRDKADREALLEGLADGTIDMIATDHAPHSAEEKGRGLEKSAMGIVGLETAFPLLYTELVKPGVISMERLMELLHDAPCRRFNIPTDTGFTVFDLNDTYRIDPADFLSMGKATPFTGWEVQGRCLLTAAGETAVWYDADRLLKGERP